MAYIIKETRSEYNLTQQELSDITGIPKRTIENWKSGKRRPSPWVEKLVKSYLKQCPKNDRGIITERKGTYEVEQIIKKMVPLSSIYDIDKIILFGSYANATPDPLNDIDLAIDGNIHGLSFFGFLEDVNRLFVKEVDLIYLKEVDKNTPLMAEIKKGIIIYERP